MSNVQCFTKITKKLFVDLITQHKKMVNIYGSQIVYINDYAVIPGSSFVNHFLANGDIEYELQEYHRFEEDAIGGNYAAFKYSNNSHVFLKDMRKMRVGHNSWDVKYCIVDYAPGAGYNKSIKEYNIYSHGGTQFLLVCKEKEKPGYYKAFLWTLTDSTY